MSGFTDTDARYVTIIVVIFFLILGLLVGIRIIVRHHVRRVRFGVFIERNGKENGEEDDSQADG